MSARILPVDWPKSIQLEAKNKVKNTKSSVLYFASNYDTNHLAIQNNQDYVNTFNCFLIAVSLRSEKIQHGK